jgi:large subunit ribosomal protein L10e
LLEYTFKYSDHWYAEEESRMHAKNYRPVKGQSNTRKEFTKGFPEPKITKFTMGDTKKQFEYEAKLIALEQAQIRHNSLEAARVASNRILMDKLVSNYRLDILPYPHNILRENKMIFGAHADRLQQGMRASFGRPIGTAARVRANQAIIAVGVNADGVETAKIALKRASAKLPIPCRIIIERKQEEEAKIVE